MERSYNLLPKSCLDLESIIQYISVELVNPKPLLSLIEKFEAKFKDICMFPKAYPFIVNSSLDNDHLRKSIVDNFTIVFLYIEGNDLVNIQMNRTFFRLWECMLLKI